MTTNLVELTVIAIAFTVGFAALTAAVVAELWGGRALSERWRRMLGISQSYSHAGPGRAVALIIAIGILIGIEWAVWLQVSDLVRVGAQLELLPFIFHIAIALGWFLYLARGLLTASDSSHPR